MWKSPEELSFNLSRSMNLPTPSLSLWSLHSCLGFVNPALGFHCLPESSCLVRTEQREEDPLVSWELRLYPSKPFELTTHKHHPLHDTASRCRPRSYVKKKKSLAEWGPSVQRESNWHGRWAERTLVGSVLFIWLCPHLCPSLAAQVFQEILHFA